MNIYKLLLGMVITLLVLIGGPYAASSVGLMEPLAGKAWFVLAVAGAGLILKALVADFVSGEFLFHKYGYDNCVIALGASLTALALQILASEDLFPGARRILGNIPALSSEPSFDRSAQLLVFFLLCLVGTLLTGRISAAIRAGTAKAVDLLALLNTGIGTALFSVYVLVLITKG